jgi:SNF2 family DNA or RNA helicase
LNLTSATATHIIDEEWNPGKRDQAYARTDRIGQELENDVYIYRIPASIDTWMSNTINRKEQMVSAFQDTMVDESADMTAESLSEAMRTGEIL